jgi:hypothetical protein
MCGAFRKKRSKPGYAVIQRVIFLFKAFQDGPVFWAVALNKLRRDSHAALNFGA